jgi:hypothetical protein
MPTRFLDRFALIAAVVAAALATEPHLATAQTSSFDVPELGARIRVSRIAATPTAGTVLARGSDSIVIGRPDGRRESVAMKDVTGLEISRGRTRNVVVGVALGLVAGAVGGVQLKKSGDRVTTTGALFKSTDPNNLYLQAAPSADTTAGNPMWVPFGMLAGTSIGTLVGVMWKERWRPAAIRRGDVKVGVLPAPESRRVSLALSARF